MTDPVRPGPIGDDRAGALARRAAETAARNSYGRLVAILAASSRDVAAAEDALADAFAAALRVWPETGVPDRPEAWLVTAARRNIGHGRRSAAVREAARAAVELACEEAAMREPDEIPDKRLELLLVCAHPAIDPGARAPLMLSAVLGLDAARIADAFLVSEAAMAKRLGRAKARIRDAGIAFERPGPEVLPERLADVLAAIYAAYSAGWELGEAAVASDLAEEAVFLARLVASLAPEEPEALGLLALLLYCEARRPARRDGSGAFVPLAEQDTRLWSRALIVEAEDILTAAARHRRMGRFQCEAAIQSAHCQRGRTGTTNWPAILQLYDILLARRPSLGAEVARAAALVSSGDPEAARAALAAIDPVAVERYQPFWATLAHVETARGDPEAARAALARAAGLTRDEAVRVFLADATRAVRER